MGKMSLKKRCAGKWWVSRSACVRDVDDEAFGGAILRPTGLILGAASGLNAKTTTTMKSETVYKSYDGHGLPQLIIGTTRDDYPYFKIQCATQEVADEWAFRIRGRQARGA